MITIDEAFAAITARAREAAEPSRPASGTRRVGVTGLDVADSDVPCEVCPTGWATVDLFTPAAPGGLAACPRCAEKARMRHASFPHLGPVVYYPRKGHR